jgi:crotonobetainyl-CoA:carnitine CoA-transferase CaiB-like acyl-CoA transferase
VGNDSQFRHFCGVIGRPALAEDVKFTTNPARLQHRKELVEILSAALKTKKTDIWVTALMAANVPAGAVNSMDKTFSLEQVTARGMRIEMDHLYGKTLLVGSPLKMSETPVEYRFAPPVRGQHTREVLENVLKIGADDIQDLEQRRIIETAKGVA